MTFTRDVRAKGGDVEDAFRGVFERVETLIFQGGGHLPPAIIGVIERLDGLEKAWAKYRSLTDPEYVREPISLDVKRADAGLGILRRNGLVTESAGVIVATDVLFP